MSEQEMKRTHEDNMRKNLSGDLLKNALEFVEHMDKTSGWEHLGEQVCFIITDMVTKYGKFFIFFNGNGSICDSEFDNYPMNDELKEFVFAKINQCTHFRTYGKECGCGEQPGHNFTILGRKYVNLCHCPICFADPDAETFEKIKELVEAWKLCIAAVKSNERGR